MKIVNPHPANGPICIELECQEARILKTLLGRQSGKMIMDALGLKMGEESKAVDVVGRLHGLLADHGY